MLTTTIKAFDTMIDVAALQAGNASALFAIAWLNELSITDDVAPGTDIYYDLAAPLPKSYYAPASTVTTNIKQALKRFQTPLDYATEFPGVADAVIDVCKANNISITDNITAGTVLVYQEKNKNVAAYFKKRGIDILTSEASVLVQQPEGIGYWYIETPDPVTIVQ